jgi:adenosylcobinamide-GDP ribazoletransferase
LGFAKPLTSLIKITMKCTFPLALTFLTVFPWPWSGEASPEDLGRSLFWYPWVGAILGLLYWGAGVLLLRFFLPPAAAALLLILTVLLTRGLHLDGLADTVDGLGGGRTPEERLAIMKDSRLGAFGAVGLVLILLLKFALLQAVLSLAQAGSLVLFPLVGRWGLVLLAGLAPYARPGGGLGQAVTEGASTPLIAGATASTFILSFLAGGLPGVVIFGLAGLAVWGLSWYFRRALGGITGDVYGAVCEILETLVLAGLVLWGP